NKAMLALAVKGNRYQAERAAESRDIPFAVQRESRYGETIGVTAMEHLELVRAWHGENAGGSDGALPIGAQLPWAPLPEAILVATVFVSSASPRMRSASGRDCTLELRAFKKLHAQI